ncbi:MAG: hypothetical protein ACE5HS_17345 [bacterium]
MILSEKVKLTIFSSEELSWRDHRDRLDHFYWTQKHQYQQPWLGSEYQSAKYLNASLAIKGIEGNYIELEIPRQATIAEVIQIARGLFPGYEKDFEEFSGMPLSYQMYYPALSEKPLSANASLSELRTTHGEILVLKQILGNSRATPKRFKDLTHFADMVALNGVMRDQRNPSKDSAGLYAVLLYSEVHLRLATYVRAYFDKLRNWSGNKLMFYVLEEQPLKSPFSNPNFWKVRLKDSVYLTWSLLGWVRSKPYQKSRAVEIARNLGAFADQLPCVVLFDNIERQEKIVIPVQGEYSAFFSKLFSTIQACLKTAEGNGHQVNAAARLAAVGVPNNGHKPARNRLFEMFSKSNGHNGRSQTPEKVAAYESLQQADSRLFESLRVRLEKSPNREQPQGTVFNINGFKVFVNHPHGLKKVSRGAIIHRLRNPSFDDAVPDLYKIIPELMRLINQLHEMNEISVSVKEQAVMTLHAIADQIGRRNGNGKRTSKKAREPLEWLDRLKAA